MKFYEQEAEIKALIKTNRKNEQIYENLRKLILAFLCKKKACNCYLDAEEVAHDLAVEMYYDIAEGEEFEYIIGFLQTIYKSKVAKYYKSKKEVFEYDPTDDLRGIYNHTSEVFHNILNKYYIEDLESVIDESLRNCRYSKNSKVYNNLKLSIMLSLLNNNTPRYFHLDEVDKPYVQLMITDVKRRVIRDKVEYTEGGVYDENITQES